MRRVYLRAAAIAVAAVAVVAGLTVYFSSQKVPPCLVSGVPKWRPPTGAQARRFELVVPDRALCFFDMDHDQAPVGAVELRGIEGITAIAALAGGKLGLRYGDGRGAVVELATGRVSLRTEPPPPPPSDTVRVDDAAHDVAYETRRGRLGFSILAIAPRRLLRNVGFEGFTWNPQFGPDPPSHGLSLAPDRPELWVLDAPNNTVHVFDVSRVPAAPPRKVDDIRLTKGLFGDERPCASHRCGRIGSLQHSADGRFVYAGDAGDVIDVKRREEIANLEALRQSRLTLEVDWVDGKPEFPAGAR
jgi:hypothetical protein